MFFKKTENILAVIIFIAMAVLPFIEIIARLFSTNFIPSSMVIVQHMTLWIGFIGAIIFLFILFIGMKYVTQFKLRKLGHFQMVQIIQGK